MNVATKLALAIWLEKHFGIPFVLTVAGQPTAAPWYRIRISLTKEDLCWLMVVCAEEGARPDLIFLKGVLDSLP